MNSFQVNAQNNHEIQKMCTNLKQNKLSLAEFLEVSSLSESIAKLIFAMYYHRIKIMQKFFNLFKKYFNGSRSDSNKT